ncbi:MAG: GTP cyclohydrolase II [Salinivirgaceae bacterium]|jgi:GTP cyclohydrolase II|nr:GTP cyclohydrolase II [Salinivirgaceae bacterium]
MIESNLKKGKKVKLPTKYGNFHLIPFQDIVTGAEHMVLFKGIAETNKLPLVRMHSACATGDLFGSLRCDCGDQLEKAMLLIQAEACGAIVYLQQEGRGIGLMNKIHAYQLQEEGMDTVDANLHLGFAPDERNYKIGADILKAIGFFDIRLLTNNLDKVNGLKEYGINISERVPLIIKSNKYNEMYLRIKRYRMGHLLGKQVAN